MHKGLELLMLVVFPFLIIGTTRAISFQVEIYNVKKINPLCVLTAKLI